MSAISIESRSIADMQHIQIVPFSFDPFLAQHAVPRLLQ
jgi:hypothetical protein